MLDCATHVLVRTTVAMALAVAAVTVSASPVQSAEDRGGDSSLTQPSAKQPTKRSTRIKGWDSRSRLVTEDRPIRVSLLIRSARSAKPRAVLIQRILWDSCAPDPECGRAAGSAGESGWRTVARQTIGRSGKATFVIRPDRKPFADLAAEQVGYRVVVPATRRVKAAMTPVKWVTVAPNGVPGPVQLVSSNAQGEPGNRPSSRPAVSPDGTKVAFTSTATNLTTQSVSGEQVYVKDLRTGNVSLVSGTAAGVPGDGISDSAAWSPDSREVVFASTATNFGPPRGTGDLWIKNVDNGSLRRLTSTGIDWAAPSPPDVLGMRSPVLWSPDGKTILAHVTGESAAGFPCIPYNGTGLLEGVCALGLGSIDVATGIITMIADGRYVMYGSGPGVPTTRPLAWSPEGALFSADVRYPCMHCEGPTLKILTPSGQVATSLVNCLNYMDYCDAQLSGWRSASELAYNEYSEGLSGGFLEGIRIWDATTGSQRTVPTPRYRLATGNLGGFSADGSQLAVSGRQYGATTLSMVQSLDVGTGGMVTWIAGPNGRVPQPRPGGYREADWGPEASDPHWVSNQSMLFVTPNALVPGDTNGVDDIVLKTRR